MAGEARMHVLSVSAVPFACGSRDTVSSDSHFVLRTRAHLEFSGELVEPWWGVVHMHVLSVV